MEKTTTKKTSPLFEEKNAFPTSTALSKYIRISPSKITFLLSKIRGKSYPIAEKIVKDSSLRVAAHLLKLLRSAKKNMNSEVLASDFLIDQAFVNQGKILKRIQPRARGKAYRIEKKFSHITIRLKCLPKT